jgi:hypothetical protein
MYISSVRIVPRVCGTAVSLVVVAVTLLASPSAALASLPGASALLTRAPYLTDVTSSSVSVTWATTTKNTGVVTYGTAGNCAAHSAAATAAGTPVSVNGVTEYQNSVQIPSLAASTSYCYRITTGGPSPVDLLGSAPSPSFTTLQAPGGTQPVTFDVLGDWGNTTNSGVNNGSVNANQAGVDAQMARSGAQFVVSPGDIGYPSGTQANYGDLNQKGADISAVFGPSYWAVPGQSLPMFPAIGNHGKNAIFPAIWPEPATVAASGGVYSMVSYPSIDGTTPASYPADYFAFTTGGVRFYVLDASWVNNNTGSATGVYQVDHDAHWTATSAEYKWLSQDLAAHHGGLKFAFFHFPLYSDNVSEPDDAYLDNFPAGSNGGGSGSLEQLLHAAGVQLVFNGHAHIYQRNIATPGGVTSYVTGGGGGSAQAVTRCSTTDAYAVGWNYISGKGSACGAAARPTSDSQVYHFLKVSVNGTAVTVTPTDSKGHTFDPMTYNFAADTTPPSAPGSLTGNQNGSGAVTLTWTPATDNIGVSAYDIYRNGTYLATVAPGVARYTDTTATSGTAYTYLVDARDLASNATGASVNVNGGPVLFSDGFESGDLSLWTTVDGLTVQPSLTHTGTYAARETSAGAVTYADKILPGSSTDMSAQAWVYVVSRSTPTDLFGFRATTSIANVYISQTGKLAVRNNVSGVSTVSTTAMPTGGWHLVTLHVLVNGASSSIDVSLDGTPVGGLALAGQNLGTSPVTAFRLGDSASGRSYDIAFDDVGVSQGGP